MEYRVVVEQRARRDADEIVSYIAVDSSAAAINWYEELYEHITSLSHMPNRCATAPEPEFEVLGIRQMVFGNYRILFTVDDPGGLVHVHHIRHGARSAASAKDLDPHSCRTTDAASTSTHAHFFSQNSSRRRSCSRPARRSSSTSVSCLKTASKFAVVCSRNATSSLCTASRCAVMTSSRCSSGASLTSNFSSSFASSPSLPSSRARIA